MMLTNLIFLALLSSGSIYAAARFAKRFEQTFSLSVMVAVLILFVFGLVGALETGMTCLYLLALCLYVLAAARLIKTQDIRGFLANMVTPGSVFLAVAWVLLTQWNMGKMASSWDEFSHWVDIVLAATEINDFGTNPAAQSTFQTYPPAMMLFQYSLQKVHMLLNPGLVFSEWRVYFAYQVCFLSVLLPFFQNVSFRQPLRLMLYGAIALLAPLLFYNNLYSEVSIDPFLGILFGAGMAMTILRKKRDGVYTAYICLLCAMLTLSKDVGIAFSLVLALAYGTDILLDKKYAGAAKRCLTAPLALAAAYLPRLLWSWEIHTSGARMIFTGKIQWTVLLDVILGRDTGYRSELVRTYRDALYSKTVSLGNVALEVNYIALMLIFFSALYVLWNLIGAKRPGARMRCGVTLGLSGGLLAAYVAGLCVVYMFKFSEYEATRLASMERYLNIAFLGVWILLLLLMADWTCQWCRKREAKLILLSVLLLVVPTKTFGDFARGDAVEQSVSAREPYEPLRAAIREYCDGDDRICFLSQGSSGYDYWVSRFNARPNSFNADLSWSIGEPFYDGDIWTQQITPEEWQKLLLAQYDYVALYRINDYFLEHFSCLFSAPEEIETNKLYRVNRETGLLDQCG